MKYILFVTSFVLLTMLNANEAIEPSTANAVSQKMKEFQYIQPIAVEEAPPEVKKCEVAQVEVFDKDGDGVYDDGDRCPNTPLGEKVDKYGCLIKKDSDKDGVPDEDDKCPNTKKGIEVDYRGCEVDSDDDGVVDSKDQCPKTSKDFMVDGYGCPQTATLRVHFASAKYNITDSIINDLQYFALFLKENKGYDVIIYGYTDSVGDANKNKALSQKRANTVKEALVRYGIKSTRLTAIGKGEENPIADNSTKEGRAQNRRIEVELIQ